MLLIEKTMNLTNIKSLIKNNTDVIGVWALMMLIFLYIMFVVKWQSDLPYHAKFVQDMLNEHRLFDNNFLMYLCANLLTLFSGAKNPIRIALVVLIASSNTAKYTIIRNVFSEWLSTKQAQWASLSLLFVFVIPVMYFLKVFGIFMSAHNMYLGYFVPNVWHNSTILCMMPFAILTYLLSVKQIENYDYKCIWKITLFLVISILIKPSFFFVYIAAFPIIMFSRYKLNKEFWHSLIPLGFGVICLLYEYISIYSGANDGSGVTISLMPLFTLSFWQSKILYILVSLALPALFVALYWKRICKDREFWFVLLMLVFAIGISWCCKETGIRASHGNFGWQVISAMWFVYYYMLKTITKTATNTFECFNSTTRGGYSQKIILALYSIHVIMGLIYLLRFLIMKDFG